MAKSKQNVKLLHATKHNPTDPSRPQQLAFTLTDPDSGSERVIVANVPPDAMEGLFQICADNGWIDDSQLSSGAGSSGPRRVAA